MKDLLIGQFSSLTGDLVMPVSLRLSTNMQEASAENIIQKAKNSLPGSVRIGKNRKNKNIRE